MMLGGGAACKTNYLGQRGNSGWGEDDPQAAVQATVPFPQVSPFSFMSTEKATLASDPRAHRAGLNRLILSDRTLDAGELPMAKWAAVMQTMAMLGLAVEGIAVNARQLSFVPPAGYGGKGGSPLATPAERGAPVLTSLPSAMIAPLVSILPSYPDAAKSSVKVIGAYRISEPAGTRLVEAWSRGAYLPVTIRFSDGDVSPLLPTTPDPHCQTLHCTASGVTSPDRPRNRHLPRHLPAEISG